MRDDKLLSDLIQQAVVDYSYETHENEFSAILEVRCYNGWTQIPDIVLYDDHPRITDPNGDKFPFWINAASQAMKAAINAVARVPGNVTPKVSEFLNKTIIELSAIQKKLEGVRKNVVNLPDN